jgi:GNAT superfamily N-acetyltransferase
MSRVVTYKDVKDPRYFTDACKIHNKAFPFDNVECNIFNMFILDDVNLDEELIIFALDSLGKVRGFLVGVEIVKEPKEAIDRFRDVIWVKDLAIDSDLPLDDWRKIIDTLLREFEGIARYRGKKGIVLYAYPPYYFMPGINIMYEDYLEFFEIRGYYKKEETVNYEVNLSQFFYSRRVAKLENKLVSEGIVFRKGREEEAETISQWVGKTFESPFWRIESLYAFKNKPPTIWIAEQGNELIGFSVYLRMGRNEFGPIGVDPKKRRHGVGTVLLFKALNDLKQLGFRYAVIPWTSHLFFYTQVPGIERIKHYYIMVKNL